MNEEETRDLVREGIRSAFKELSKGADYWRDDGDLRGSAAYVISDAADRVVQSLTPVKTEPEPEPCHHAYATNVKGHSLCQLCGSPRPSAMPDWCDACQQDKPCVCADEPEPVNPFAPLRTALDWASDIQDLMQQAQNDGHTVWIDNRCCGCCSKMSLRVGSDDTAPLVWGNDD